MKKNNLKEDDKLELAVTPEDVKKNAKELADLQRNPDVKITFSNKPKSGGISGLFTEDDILEPEAVITPQDPATIKYLSNVIDNKTGEISQPFTIGTQKYQMVRGMGVDKQIVMAVFAHSETDDNGENIIHSIEDFEKNIAIPMREKLELECMVEELNLLGADIQMVPETKETTYEGSRHFFVNEKTKGVRSFKNIKEMLEGGKLDEETYMGLSEFKKHMNKRMFGERRKINELGNEPVDTTQQADATQQGDTTQQSNSGVPQEINNQHILPEVNKVIELMVQRLKSYLDKIDKPNEKTQFVAAITKMLNIPTEWKGKLFTSIKSMFNPQQMQVSESRIITKKQLSESLKPNKVIKTIKVKDIRK
jgi:hypothetical protein